VSNLFNLRFKVLVILAILVLAVVPSFAQVTLNIPTDEIFTQTNTWMAALANVVTIGPAIAIAIALISFVAYSILKGLKG